MPKDKSKQRPVTQEITPDARDQSYRHSLQPKSSTADPSSPFRHTQSQNYGNNKTKKVKTKIPSIPELDSPDAVDEPKVPKIRIDAVNEKVRVSLRHPTDVDRKSSKRSTRSSSSRPNSLASNRGSGVYDNPAFEAGEKAPVPGHLTRNSSAANSIRSTQSNRPPSVQSGVLREQYCCCSRWTPCERTLFAAVGVLLFIIILLVIAVALLARDNPDKADKLLSKIIN